MVYPKTKFQRYRLRNWWAVLKDLLGRTKLYFSQSKKLLLYLQQFLEDHLFFYNLLVQIFRRAFFINSSHAFLLGEILAAPTVLKKIARNLRCSLHRSTDAKATPIRTLKFPEYVFLDASTFMFECYVYHVERRSFKRFVIR